MCDEHEGSDVQRIEASTVDHRGRGQRDRGPCKTQSTPVWQRVRATRASRVASRRQARWPHC